MRYASAIIFFGYEDLAYAKQQPCRKNRVNCHRFWL